MEIDGVISENEKKKVIGRESLSINIQRFVFIAIMGPILIFILLNYDELRHKTGEIGYYGMLTIIGFSSPILIGLGYFAGNIYRLRIYMRKKALLSKFISKEFERTGRKNIYAFYKKLKKIMSLVIVAVILIVPILILVLRVVPGIHNITYSIIGIMLITSITLYLFASIKKILVSREIKKKNPEIFINPINFTDNFYLRLKKTFKIRMITCYIGTFSGAFLFLFWFFLPSIQFLKGTLLKIVLDTLTFLSILLVIGMIVRTYYLFFKFIDFSEMKIEKELKIRSEN